MATVREWKSKHWVLHDPASKKPSIGKDLFRAPEGISTDDIGDAEMFPSEDDARSVGAVGPENWQPRRVSDFLP